MAEAGAPDNGAGNRLLGPTYHRGRPGRVEPTLGFEPRTCCLRNSCSTAELCRPGQEVYQRALMTARTRTSSAGR